jgi:FkbM family methyltransferase
MKSHVLPNGLTVKHTHMLETIHLYQDIFVLRVYLQHGITLPEHSVVIDGGANIGMFSLFVLENCPTASIHAFEPAPRTFEVLKANLSSRGKVVLNNCGLGSQSAQELFTYMPGATMASGYYDEQMIVQMKERMRETILADPQKSRSYKGPLGEELLNEKGISIINLLKLDVECRERAVLSGIRDEHWPMIQQVVIEVHTRLDDPMPEVLSIFDKRGFSVAYEPEEGLLTTIVYARRMQQS